MQERGSCSLHRPCDKPAHLLDSRQRSTASNQESAAARSKTRGAAKRVRVCARLRCDTRLGLLLSTIVAKLPLFAALGSFCLCRVSLPPGAFSEHSPRLLPQVGQRDPAVPRGPSHPKEGSELVLGGMSFFSPVALVWSASRGAEPTAAVLLVVQRSFPRVRSHRAWRRL